MKEIDTPDEAEIVKGVIDDILSRIKQDANPDELNRIRRIVRRCIPFTMRGYFMAYMLRALLQRKNPESRGKGPVKQAAFTQRKGNTTPKRGVPSTEHSTFTTLFVGIGKNRRIFPRDLRELLKTAAGIENGDVKDVKVLDNYSFVEIAEKHARKAIDSLSGMELRGRKIVVNFARKKDEETAS